MLNLNEEEARVINQFLNKLAKIRNDESLPMDERMKAAGAYGAIHSLEIKNVSVFERG